MIDPTKPRNAETYTPPAATKRRRKSGDRISRVSINRPLAIPEERTRDESRVLREPAILQAVRL
jgi:hypothetical protein